MKKIYLALIATFAVLHAGTIAEKPLTPVTPIDPIEVPAKTVVLIGVNATYIHKKCNCGESTAVHAGIVLGADYALTEYIGISARVASSWLQTGLYARIGDMESVYGLVGYNHSFDIKSGGISYGVGITPIKDFNVEVIGTNIEDDTLVNLALGYRL